jgi:hypothetical protein
MQHTIASVHHRDRPESNALEFNICSPDLTFFGTSSTLSNVGGDVGLRQLYGWAPWGPLERPNYNSNVSQVMRLGVKGINLNAYVAAACNLDILGVLGVLSSATIGGDAVIKGGQCVDGGANFKGPVLIDNNVLASARPRVFIRGWGAIPLEVPRAKPWVL